ncbi:hypothetical protein [Halioxenophilus aromaticivorans]|uniref:Uncharacterized protein n=1 Tax=Halioxenophilus aromaticivorans TaxID=1306992 RepID=A0AAV3U170_9ALTE
MNIKRLLMLIPFILVSQQTLAEKLYICDLSCDSSGKLARQIAPKLKEGTIFSVVNIINYTANTYRVKVVRKPHGIELYTYQIVATTTKSRSAIADIEKAAIQFLKPYAIPSSVTPSAYDMLQSSSSKYGVALHLRNNLSLADRLKSFSSRIANRTGISDFDSKIEVEFGDGTVAEFEFDGLDSHKRWKFKYVPGSSRDYEGNEVPEQRQSVPGVYQFPSYSIQTSFIRYVDRMFGINTLSPTACSGSYVVECSFESNGEIKCVAKSFCR